MRNFLLAFFSDLSYFWGRVVKVDLGTIFIMFVFVTFIFGLLDSFIVSRLGLSHSISILLLSALTVGLIGWVSGKRDEYWESLLRTRFDSETVERMRDEVDRKYQ